MTSPADSNTPYPGSSFESETLGGLAAPQAWDSPQRILPISEPVAPYPIPESVRGYVLAIQELAGCSVPTAAGSVLGSLNVLASTEYDVRGLAPKPSPTSLYVVVSASSGFRKSTAFELAFGGHHTADSKIVMKWSAAKADYQEWHQKGAGKGSKGAKAPPKARKFRPVALRTNATLEALIKRLMLGRDSQTMACSEAGAWLGAWPFQKTQRSKTLSELSSMWEGAKISLDRSSDDEEYWLEGRRLSMLLMAQPLITLNLVFSDDAANGFTPRLLLSQDETRPPAVRHSWPDGTSPGQLVNHLHETIVKIREAQDRGSEFAPSPDAPPPSRTVVTLDTDARDALKNFHNLCEGLADQPCGQHESSYWIRAPEQAARVAATLAVFLHHRGGGGRGERVTVGQALIDESTAVTQWYGLELRRLAGMATAVADARAAEAMVPMLLTGLSTSGIGDGRSVKLLTLMSQRASGHAHHLRGDPDARRRIIEILEEYGYVRPEARRGWFEVNPRVIACV